MNTTNHVNFFKEKCHGAGKNIKTNVVTDVDNGSMTVF